MQLTGYSLGCFHGGFHGGQEEPAAADVCVRLAPRCDLLTYFPRRMSSDVLRVGIRIPAPLSDGFRGFLRNAGPGPGRRCEPPSRFLLRDVWLCSSVKRCILMPLPDSFFCNPVPVRLSFH